MKASHFQTVEALSAILLFVLCCANLSAASLHWSLIPVLLLVCWLDTLRVAFPFYGYFSVSIPLLLASTALDVFPPQAAVLGFVPIIMLRRKPTPDLLPGVACFALLLDHRVVLAVACFVFFFLSLSHPLLRSRFYPRLPGALVYRSWPFLLGSASIAALASWEANWFLWVGQSLALLGLMGLVRSQRGMNLESAQMQESRKLRADQLKESLLLIDTLSYSLHRDALPEQVLSRVCKAMVDVSNAETFALVERNGSRWRVVSEKGLDKELAIEQFGKIEKDMPRTCKAISLQSGWNRESFAVIIPWESEGALYLGRSKSVLESIPLLERLARLGSAALRTAREKEAKLVLSQRGEELERWVEDLRGLLREVHFVAATLERSDLLERLRESLTRTLNPETAIVFGFKELEFSWGEGPETPLALSTLKNLPLGTKDGSPIPGHKSCTCIQLGENRLFLSSLREDAFDKESLNYLAALGDIVGTFLSNSRLYSELRVAHEELEQSQSALLQANKLAAIGQLAAGVAHELNSPFQAISVHLDLLKGALSDEDDIECADTIAQALERCRIIVKELLHFSHQPHSAPTQLSIPKILSQSAIAAGIPGIAMDCQESLIVMGHDHELVSLFTNLLSNARDAVVAHSPGAIAHDLIRVSAKVEGNHCLVRLEDKGGGIPDHVKDRIFEPFFTTKEVGSGTGLGLYMVYSYVVNAGGDIRFQTGTGVGTTFEVELPVPS